MKYAICLLLILAVKYQTQAFKGKYPIQNFTTAEYKAGIQNIDFAQNRDMTLFVANNLGVLAFNGNEWEVKAFKTGKKQRSLAFHESSNRLYVGSQGDFGYFKDDWEYVSLLEKIPETARNFDEVWDVFIFNAKVYFCTFQAIYVFDGERISVIGHEAGLGRSFHVDGKLFTQSGEGELFELKNEELVPFNPLKNNSKQVIAGIVSQNEGYIFFYNSGKVESSTYLGVENAHEALGKALEGKYVNHVLQLSDTRLVISTQTSGLYLYDLQSQSMENIAAQDGLMSNACLRSFQDHAGNLWVGMQSGISIIGINSPIRLINQDIDLQGSGYEAFETDEGTYFTTSNGIYYLANGAGKSIFLSGTEGPAYGFQEIAGKLYAGHHTGLFLLSKGSARRLVDTEGLWQVKRLKSRPQYAIGGTYSGLFLFRLNANLVLEAVRKIEGFVESSRFFEEDQKGRIWVGQFYKGLYQLDLDENLGRVAVKKVSDNYDLPINDQLILTKINNELYFATKAGIYKLDQNTDEISEARIFAETIGEQSVDLLIEDNKKNIYVIAENLVGFYKQLSNNNYVSVPSSLFQFRYSFNNDLLNTSVNVRNGILFNANEGFIHYDPDREFRSASEKGVIVNKVFSITEDSVLYSLNPFEERRTEEVQIEASAQAKVLQFQIASFRFQDVNNQEFQYYLEGFDRGYGEWTDATTKEYTNLREGSYSFSIRTRNHLGEITTSEPITIYVAPPFYRSPIAIVLYVLLGLAALAFLFRLQRRRIWRKAELQEEAKRRELERKEAELLELEKQKEQELLQLKEEKMKSEFQHLNSLLAASTMNIVVKNEFIETIKEELKEVKRKGKSKDTKIALERLVKEIDHTLRLQEDWEQFKLHFDQVHGDFLSRLRTEYRDLSPNDEKLCAFLKLNLDTKGIANLMGISVRGIEVARYRLRKKLNLEKGQNLTKFILEY